MRIYLQWIRMNLWTYRKIDENVKQNNPNTKRQNAACFLSYEDTRFKFIYIECVNNNKHLYIGIK